MIPFWYLATPYGQYAMGRDSAFRLACDAAGLLMQNGVPVYSPIAHNHAIINATGIEFSREHDFWMNVDRPFMEAAHGIIILQAHGWASSRGVAHEIEYFDQAFKPRLTMWPGEVPTEFKRCSG